MNLELIKTKYPRAFDKMKVWGKQQLIQGVGLPVEITDSFPDEMLLPALVNSRALLDFFDSYDVFITIKRYTQSNKWSYTINEEQPSVAFSERKEAEQTGFFKGFEILENLLR